MPLKILQVIHSVDPRGGGAIEGVKQLSAALIPLGASVDVLSLDAPDAPCVRNFPMQLFALGPGRTSFGYTPWAVPWLRQRARDYDIVLVNGMWQFSGYSVWLASQKTGLPYVVFQHGMLDPWFKRRYPLKHLKKWLYWPWGEYRVLRDARAVFFTSEEEKLQARKSFRLYRCNEKVVGYGIARPPGDATRQRTFFLEKFPQLADKRIILFLGRIHEKKGCDMLLAAFRQLVGKRQEPPDYHLVMAGPADGAFAAQMQESTRLLGLDPYVTWTGMLSGDLKWGAFRAADAFILPSHQENFGVSVVEALACGVPVLISDQINIWREIAADQAGLVEKDDIPGTLRLLERWVDLPVEEKAAMRRETGHCFEKNFLATTVAQRVLATLHELTH